MHKGLLLIQRALPLAVLLIAGVSVPVMVLSPQGLSRLEHLKREKERAELEVSRLSAEIRALRSEVARIKDDPAMIERTARDELGLVRKTEVVFQFRD